MPTARPTGHLRPTTETGRTDSARGAHRAYGTDRKPAGRPLWRDRAGRVLRARRLAQGLRLADVARRAGLSAQYLSEIERGRKEPSSEVLDAACGALGMDLLDLVLAVGDGLGARAGLRLVVGGGPVTPPPTPGTAAGRAGTAPRTVAAPTCLAA